MSIARRRGFTIIELLVVVAVIAILAAIAVPNFLEAQVRSKVSRARADMRAFATALETYRSDFERYPPSCGTGPYVQNGFPGPVSVRLIPLTTPVSYFSSIPSDPFSPNALPPGDPGVPETYDTYDYIDADNCRGWGSSITSGSVWRLVSAGPDLLLGFGGSAASISRPNPFGVDYDPTNGTTSNGDIVRIASPAPARGGAPDDLSNPDRPGILRVPFYREQY